MTPKIRQSIYYLSTAASACVGLLLIWNGMSTETAGSLTEIIGGLGALLGSGGAATAASQVKKQRADGTFDQPSAVEQVVTGVRSLQEAKERALAEVEEARLAVVQTVGEVPLVGPLARDAIDNLLPRF